jgi:hypothetical protein
LYKYLREDIRVSFMATTFDGIINEPIVDYVGKDGFFWWFGEVVDNKDPLRIGRVKVRIIGWYTGTDDKFRESMPDADLPWAVVLQSTNQSGIDGTGESAGQLQAGAMVMGFFMDGQEAQAPVVMGVVRAQKNDSTENGLIQGIFNQKHTTLSKTLESPGNGPIQGGDGGGPSTATQPAPGSKAKPSSANPLQDIAKLTDSSHVIPEANALDSNFEKHLESMFGELAYTVSHIVPSNGNLVNIIDGTVTNVEALIGKIKNLVSGIFSEALAGLKELILQQISKIVKKIRLFGKTGIPLIITAAIQSIIQLVLSLMCNSDASFLNQALSIMNNFSGFILGLVGQALNSIISMLSKAFDSLVNSIICAINDAYDTIRGIISVIKAAVSVAKAVSEVIKKGTGFFENLEKIDINTISSITSIISLILGLLVTQCDRTVPVDKLSNFVPFFGSTSCASGTPAGLGGTGPGECGSGGRVGGFSASLNAAANLVQSVVKTADPYKTTVKNFENGYAQAQLSTPGQLATITKYPSGATHTSIRHNSETYQKWKKEIDNQKKGAQPSQLTEGNPKNTVIGDEYEFFGATDYRYHKDHAISNKGKFVHTVEGDYKLKIVGNMDVEIDGRLAFRVKGAPQVSTNTGGSTGNPSKQAKNMILFDSDTEISSRGKIEMQGVGTTTAAKPGTDVKIVSDNLNLNAPSLNINCTNDLKLCAGNAIYVETPSLIRNINMPPLPRAKAGIFTIMFGSYDMIMKPGLGTDTVPRYTVTNTLGPIKMTSGTPGVFITAGAGAMVLSCLKGALSINAASGPLSIFSGSAMNLTATATMALTAAVIKLN